MVPATPLLLDGVRVTETDDGHVRALRREGAHDAQTDIGGGTRYENGLSADRRRVVAGVSVQPAARIRW